MAPPKIKVQGAVGRGACRAGRGFTLVEMVLSLTILAIILSATYSVVLLASRLVPNKASPQSCTLSGARTLEQFSADVTYAITVTQLQAHSIAFTVPDRTGDSVAESIRYSWSGVAGDPLMYSFNGGADCPIAYDVREFDTTAASIAVAPPPAYAWGGEQLLASNTSLLSLASAAVASTAWFGQTFLPVLSSDVRNWKITRVRISACADGTALGQAAVQIRSVSGGLPTSTVLDQATLSESTLGILFSWQQFSFASVPAMSRTTPACLVVQWISDTKACDLQYQNTAYSGVNSVMVTSINSGSSWTGLAGSGMLFEVYGQLESLQTPTIPIVIDQVRCGLRLGSSASSRVETVVRTLNQPYTP